MSEQSKMFKILPHDFESALGTKVSDFVCARIKEANLEYSLPSQDERDSYILRIIDTLLDPLLTKSGEHRLPQWEAGWGENLSDTQNNLSKDAIVPKYYNKYPVLRWNQQFIKPQTKNMEYAMLGLLMDWVFDNFMRDAQTVYEFGCGTGHHLFRLREINKDARLWGLDWATSSQEILNKFRESGIDRNLYSHRFDYFNPDNNFDLDPQGVLYTVASLEQIGDRTEEFIQYVLRKRPKLCVHVEPIGELLDRSKLLDDLSVRYFEKRNYLNGFLTRLRELEQEGRITLHLQQRSNIGSFFIEGYSIVVWSLK